MKVFGKWIVMGYIDGRTPAIAAHFKTKREAQRVLDELFTKLADNRWVDSIGHHFYIEKNTAEYR